jgi:hypothetical protein
VVGSFTFDVDAWLAERGADLFTRKARASPAASLAPHGQFRHHLDAG